MAFFLTKFMDGPATDTVQSNVLTSCITIIDRDAGIREGVNGKKTFSFRHSPNDGEGGLPIPMPEFFGPLFRSAFLVNKKSLFLQKCQCIELLTVF